MSTETEYAGQSGSEATLGDQESLSVRQEREFNPSTEKSGESEGKVE